MKSILIFPVLTLALLAACTSGAVYSISGTAPTDGHAIYLIDSFTGETLDSALVTDGSFNFTGKAGKDALLYISEEGSDWMTQLFNDGTPITVNLQDTTLQGSPLNEDLLACDKQVTAKFHEVVALSRSGDREKMMTEYEAYVGLLKGIFADHSASLLPAAFVPQIIDELEEEDLAALFDTRYPYAKHPYALQVKQRWEEQNAKFKAMEEQKQKIVGQQFLDLEEPDTEGVSHKLSEFVGKGKWVLVDFWASWCGPCRAEMPNVVAAYDKYHAQGFDVVGLSFDNDKDAWMKAITDLKMPWIHLSDLKGWQTVASDVYNVKSIPDNILVDPDGKIVARGLRGEDLGARLEAVFNK